jgi:two-component system, OmpR family, response regulator
MTQHILVVDDDPNIRQVICFALEKAGMKTVEAKDGAEALSRFQAQKPALIVLDIGMPEMDGLEVCRQIRKSAQTPILFLSARDEEIDRVLGLEMGGDDYVTKPFSPRELAARVNAILRRAANAPADAVDEEPLLKRGMLALDKASHSVTLAEKPVALTALEFQLLKSLLTRPSMVFRREQLLSAAYPGNIHVADRTIDSHIRNIRAKFSVLGCESVIETVHGVGFRLGRCEAAS